MYKRMHMCFLMTPLRVYAKAHIHLHIHTYTYPHTHIHTYTHVNSQTECKEISRKSDCT